VLQLARVLDIDPRDLFTQRQMAGEVKSTVVRHVDEEDLLSLGGPETRMLTSDYNLENDIGRQLAVDKVLDTLNPRERRIVIRKFGLDGDPAFTYEELARRLGVTAARVQQIEARALRKLKHPSRADILRPYAVSDD
jgi:RNA polymerase sigma factor (sigma-70 family)